MGQHLAQTERLASYRKSRFPTQFLDDLGSLIKTVVKEISERYNKVGCYDAKHAEQVFVLDVQEALS